jgi:hypothetical protein
MAVFFFIGFGAVMAAAMSPMAGMAGAPPYVTMAIAIGRELCRFELWFSVFLVAVPTYSYTAWRLIDFNLDRHRSFWRKLFRSLSVYTVITVFLIGLWFALRFCLDGV